MKNSLSAAAVHKQYDEGISAFRRHLADPALRMAFGKEIDPFMQSCALGVWGKDGGLGPKHTEYYNAIYCKGNPVPSVLYWEMATGVADYKGFQAPLFFQKLIAYDVQNGRHTARRFIDTFTLMLLLFAAVDDIVSEGEAGFVNSCADFLSALCDAGGISPDKQKLNVDEFITHNLPSVEDDVLAPAAQVSGVGAAQTAEKEEPPEPAPSLEELLAELESLCGLQKVKEDVKSLINLVKVRKLREEAELPVPPMSLHLVFMGNPGTGKTTVARLLAKIYRAIGVLSKGQLVEVDRSGLVAGFVGQTALKTGEVIQKALGGVLFIDEAYALVSQDSPNDFGHEAIEVLLKGMEDHRKDLIVIVAGYTELMGKFISSNPGLESRFNKYFYFDDYAGGELLEIFKSMCEKNGYTLDGETEAFARDAFQKLYEERDENFGNARDVRNIFEAGVSRQSNRVAAMASPQKEDLMSLKVEDLQDPDEENET
ncbi:MAG: AAA family ATPase [Oscillospiraceae bacterium]